MLNAVSIYCRRTPVLTASFKIAGASLQPPMICKLQPRRLCSATEQHPLVKRQTQLVQDIAQDLEFTNEEMSKPRPLKKNLTALKEKWQLSSRIAGRDVTAKEACDAVHSELQKLHELELQSLQQLETSAQFTMPVVPTSDQLASGKLQQQPLALLSVATCASVAFAAWHLFSWMEPLVAKAELSAGVESASTTVETASSSAGTAHPPGLDGDDSGDTCNLGTTTAGQIVANHYDKDESSIGSSDAFPGTVANSISTTSDTANASQGATSTACTDGGSTTPGSSTWQVGAYCLVSIAVVTGLVVGSWWLFSSRNVHMGDLDSRPSVDGGVEVTEFPPDPEPPEITAPTAGVEQMSFVAPPTSPSMKANWKQPETIFENAPVESQVWDMSASIRGVPGRVKNRIRQFE